MGEDLVRDDRGVVVDVHFFDGEGGHFGEEDAAEGIGDGGIQADKREGGFERVIAVELDFEVLRAVSTINCRSMEKAHSSEFV